MLIKEIYKKYAQPPMLQLHQLRVASVGLIILNSLSIEDNDAVKSLLLHDLGNIVRIKFGIFKNEDYGDLGLDYYKGKQNEYIKKFGFIDHSVTESMLKEIGVNERIIELVNKIKWENIQSAIESNDLIFKIINYSDMRVGPNGILTAIERIDEVNKRKENWVEYDLIRELVIKLESQIFKNSNISPDKIQDNIVNRTLKVLENWDI